MNGLLTALLGGTQGLGQGLHEEDERAMKLRAEKMNRLSMAVEMAKSGVTPPDELTADWPSINGAPSQPSAPNLPTPQAAAPPPVPRGTLTKLLPQWAGPQDAPQNATPSPTQPGGMSGTDAVRSAARNVGGFKMDVTKSFPYQMAVGVKAAEQEQAWELARQGMVIKAQDLMRAGTRMPDGSPMTMDQALAVASNGEQAFQRAPVLGSDAYNRAKAGEVAATAPGEISKAVGIARGTAPIEVGKAVGIAQATAPIDVAKATQITQNTEPMRVAGQKEVQRAGQDFQQAQQARQQAGNFANEIGVKQFEQNGQIMPNLIRGLKGSSGAPSVAPSTQVNPLPNQPNALPPLTEAQALRAKTDSNYKAFLLAKGYKVN